MNQRPKLRAETVKLLEENIGGKVHDIGCGDNFLDMTPKAQTTKGKMENLYFIQNEKLLYVTNTIKRGKYLYNGTEHLQHISDKGVIRIICKDLLQLNKTNNPIQKWIKMGLEYIFLKGDIQMGSKHIKKMLSIASY